MAYDLTPFELGAAQLRGVLEKCWDADTSAYELFDADRPSDGQCAVTALVVHDVYGGTFRRAVNSGDSHYWNAVDDGTGELVELDLTRDQFPVWAPRELSDAPRERLVSSPATVARYELLRARVVDFVAGQDRYAAIEAALSAAHPTRV